MAKRPLHITPGGLAGSLFILLAAALCVRLGFWQLDRLEQRLERNRLIEERMVAPVLMLTSADIDTAGLAYRTVELRGEYDLARSFVLAGRAMDGSPGVHIVTPLRLENDGGFVLVNRGWLPSPDAASVDLAPYREIGPIHLHGMAVPFFPSAEADARERSSSTIRIAAEDDERTPHRVWFRPDDQAVRASLPYPVADFIVQALPQEGAPERPKRIPPPTLDRGPHLGYAIQWFCFAAVALVGWAVMVFRRDEKRSDIRSTATSPR